MGLFGKSAQQKGIDDLFAENLRLYAEIAKTGALLTDAKNRIFELEQQASWSSTEIDRYAQMAAGFREERDSYRERLLRFTAPRERGPGGRFVKPKPATNGAAGQAVRHG